MRNALRRLFLCMTTAAKFLPSAERNKGPLLDVLKARAPFAAPSSSGLSVLEVGSGTGQHCAHLCAGLPCIARWQPTEFAGGSDGPEASAYGDLAETAASVAGHATGIPAVLPLANLDASAAVWPAEMEAATYDAIVAINVAHISPYAVTEGLLSAAARLLAPSPDAALVLYGPWNVDGEFTAPSNEAFNDRLKAQNAEWGIRDATAVGRAAEKHGLRLDERVEMPANNFVLVFRRAA